MTATLLIINAGSSSVKFSLFGNEDDLPLLAKGKISDIEGSPCFTVGDESKALPTSTTHEAALKVVLEWIESHTNGQEVRAVGHRIVHGGTALIKPVKLDDAVMAELRALCPLAPLHQPHNLAAVDILSKLKPDLLQIGCFDTAFHAGHEELYSVFALPQDLRNKGIRRYGFHGLSYEWIAHVLRRDHPNIAESRVIVAHLGNGASLCALKNAQSIDTTMGMTALDGLPMGTRCGALDPGALIYMIRDCGLNTNEAERLLYNESGLKGLSGLGNDVKMLLDSSDPRSAFALDYFSLKTAQYIAMMAVSLGGVDALVFTGGIGEHATPVQENIIDRLSFLNISRILVIPANEERIIAQHVRSSINPISEGYKHEPRNYKNRLLLFYRQTDVF